MAREYEISEEYSRSRRRDPSVPPPPRNLSPEYYANGPVHIIETEAVPPPVLSPPYPLSPRGSPDALQLPVSRGRPRSVPPVSTAVINRRLRSRSRSMSSDDEDHNREIRRSRKYVVRDRDPKSPVQKAGDVLKDKFSESSMGLGVGLLGAAVGAWVAHEATDARDRHRNGKEYEGYDGTHRPRSPKDSNKSKIALTVLGAMVGGLGANAIERQFEDARERDRGRRIEWERKLKYHEDDGDYRLDRRGVSRSRSRGGRVSEVVEVRRGRHYRREGDEAEVEDYVYEETRPRRRRSEDAGYNRYRN